MDSQADSVFQQDLKLQVPRLHGEHVRELQFRVAHDLAALVVAPDGVFGPMTEAGLRAWQAARGLPATGVCDRALWQTLFPAASIAASHPTANAAPRDVAGQDMPITRDQALQVKDWLLSHYGSAIAASVAGTPVDADLVAAIAGKETACFWVSRIDAMSPDELLPLMVFDASGDFPDTSRSAFPRDAAALRADPRYGDALTDMLIAEANAMRHALHGWSPSTMLYKGYGIFQYDLQNIETDEAFFRDRLWYRFDACLDRLMRELHDKLRATTTLFDAVRAYNGSGPKAEAYAAQVMLLRSWCAAN